VSKSKRPIRHITSTYKAGPSEEKGGKRISVGDVAIPQCKSNDLASPPSGEILASMLMMPTAAELSGALPSRAWASPVPEALQPFLGL
jgi:hypothetical protein